MTDHVVGSNEVRLNSVRYPTVGQISPQLVSNFADKQVIGDYSKESDPNKSSWVIVGDQRGGLLVEEMDEKIESNRFWWSNCETRLKGHLALGDLASSISLNFDATDPLSYADGSSVWANETNCYDNNTATYAVASNVASGAWSGYLELIYTGSLANCVGCRIWASVDANTVVPTIQVDLYYSAAYHTVYTGPLIEGAWRYYGAGSKQTIQNIRIRIKNNDGVARSVWVHEADFLTLGTAITGQVPLKFCNFNNNLYLAADHFLYKLDSTGAYFAPLTSFPASITDLVASVNGVMVIVIGNGNNYWYMSAAEAFTETNITTCDLGVVWDDKQFLFDNATNTIYYTATPNSATPAYTANGVLDQVPFGAVNRLEVDVDADGNTVIYAGTTKGVWAHDYTNAQWERPKVQTPEHANGGKGFISWHSGLHYSAGLNVKLYVADNSPAIIANEGLDQRDGLPVEYAGEIMNFVGGYDEFYALVDAGQVTGTGYSAVYGHDDSGAWRCIWADPTVDQTIACGIVSSAGSSFRLYWNVGDDIYYIPLQRSLQNPLKVTNKTFATSGVHISPWFDADWQLGNKVAYRIRVGVYGNVSADEPVQVSYRVNHSTDTIGTVGAEWTSLGTIVASGETIYQFASSVGLAFKAIQFRFDLVRAGASTTETPDVSYATLEYGKILPKKWGWQFVVDCTKRYNDLSPEQLLDALETAANLETLMTFMFEDSTKYVQVKSVLGSRLTGVGRRGEYTVFVQEV